MFSLLCDKKAESFVLCHHIQIDQQLLLDASLPSRKRMAIQVRLSEKLILTTIGKEIEETEVEVMEVKRKREDGNGDGGRKKSRA